MPSMPPPFGNAYATKLKALDVALLPAESRVRADLSKINPGLVAKLDGVSALTSPEASLVKAVADIEAQQTALKADKFDELIIKLEAEHIALRQRQVLSKNIDDVAAFVEGLVWNEKAGKARPTTRFITDKQRTLFQSLIEGAYKERLKEECGKLDFVPPVKFKARGSSGKTLRGLEAQGGYKPEDIFSEGEQRALALADFLTEVNLNLASAAIILDDPVTSLDHTRKKFIVRRLVEEATIRQVIVFTHDIVFMTMLTELAKVRDKLPIEFHWIERDCKGRPGIVKSNESPTNHKAYLSVNLATESLAKAKKAGGQERVDLIEKGAGSLRRTIEETIIYELFNGTVQRWDEQIRVSNLRQVFWSDEAARELRELHGEVSRLIGAHSHSDVYTVGTPDPADLERLIERVKNVKKVISDGKKSRD